MCFFFKRAQKSCFSHARGSPSTNFSGFTKKWRRKLRSALLFPIRDLARSRAVVLPQLPFRNCETKGWSLVLRASDFFRIENPRPERNLGALHRNLCELQLLQDLKWSEHASKDRFVKLLRWTSSGLSWHVLTIDLLKPQKPEVTIQLPALYGTPNLAIEFEEIRRDNDARYLKTV